MKKRKVDNAKALKRIARKDLTIQNEARKAVHNGIQEALLGFTPSTPNGAPLSQVDTLFYNERWYLISNMRQLLSQMYVEHGLIQTIVDVPVDDAFRGGIEIKSKQLDEDQLLKLKVKMKRQADVRTMAQGLKWNRLYGGAGVVIITDQDPSTPLNLESMGPDSYLEFHAVDMWELFWDQQAVEGFDAIEQEEKFEFFSYYGVKLHKSRVMKLKGLTAPSFIRPRLRGWGFSVVEALVRSINQYLKANDLSFEVLDEFKLDVFKLKNLTSTLMKQDGAAAIQRRVQLANAQKSFQNAMVLDSEDEYDHKQLSFTGLSEVMLGIRLQIASDMRMPLSKLFGVSAQGFNSGEDDIEVYNSMVESQVREKSEFDLLRMVEIRCQHLFGFIPDDLEIEFEPLRVLSSEQEETVKTQKFNRLLAAKTAGEITTFEFRESCNRDNLLSIQLDTSEDKLNPEDPEIEDVLSGKNDDEAEEDGANRPDSQKSKAKK